MLTSDRRYVSFGWDAWWGGCREGMLGVGVVRVRSGLLQRVIGGRSFGEERVQEVRGVGTVWKGGLYGRAKVGRGVGRDVWVWLCGWMWERPRWMEAGRKMAAIMRHWFGRSW